MKTAFDTLLLLQAAAPSRDQEEFVTELGYIPAGWTAVAGGALILAICWLVVWMYRREGRMGSSLRRRTVLAGVRCVVLLLLAVVFLDPVRVRILRRWADSYTLVMVDQSSSMGLSDDYSDEERAKLVARYLPERRDARRMDLVRALIEENDRSWLKGLAANNRVRIFGFSEDASIRETVRATREPGSDAGDSTRAISDVDTAFESNGTTTNLHRSMRRAVDSLGHAPVAAIVVLSDGGFNDGSPVAETARFAKDRLIPVHVVGIGDPNQPTNIRVSDFLGSDNAFVGDPISLTATLVVDGLVDETITVELHEQIAGRTSDSRVVETRSIPVGADGSIDPVTFTCEPGRVGRYTYSVIVPPLARESVTDDNVRQRTVNVLEARTKVLLVAGGPSWEYRFLSRLLERDKSFDLSCWLQSADRAAVRDGNTVIDHLPDLAEELYAYDVVILMDPARNEFDEEWCRLTETFVADYGGGLLLAAGRPRTPSFLREPKLEPLRDILPVEFDPEVDLLLNAVGHYQLKAAPIELGAPGHAVMRQADDIRDSTRLWHNVAQVYWHYPVLREKLAATVLLRHASTRMRNSFGGHVLLATQYVGAGRTAFLATDGTWRWRRQGEAFFDRFWVQLVRHLAEGKLHGGTKRGTLLTDGEQFALGDAVRVSARLVDTRYQPIKDDTVSASYTVEEEPRTFELKKDASRPGWFEGQFVPDRTGLYQIAVRLPKAAAGDELEVTRAIRVTRPNLEILKPQMDLAALQTLAEGSHGGKYFDIDEAQTVPELIPDCHEELAIRSRPTALWDNGAVLSILLALLSVEWFVRKWSRML